VNGHRQGTETKEILSLPGRSGSECGRDLGERGCGDEGTRTPNPCLAKAVLCQLSYAPVGVVSDLV
jgi:hypothetical protein